MHLVMFDIDGTLLNSSGFEDECYLNAIRKVIHHPVNEDWSTYTNATDSGILDEIIEKNGLGSNRREIHSEVKRFFIDNIKSHLLITEVKEIKGASSFMDLLRQRDDVALAIATGGWEETARMKLEAAGIDYSGIAFASCEDHFSRTGIMKQAEARCPGSGYTSKTYFGDAAWDKKASRDLNFNFILVGDRINHPKQIRDFTHSGNILDLIGLC